MIKSLFFTAALILVKANVDKIDVETPVDCKGKWINFGDCSKTCGCGVQRQIYEIITEASNGGKICSTDEGDLRGVTCNEDPCPITIIGEWSDCSVPCGEGEQTRTIKYEDGTDVPGMEKDKKRTCNMRECCEVGEWGTWSECSSSCGPGTRSRSRDELTNNGYGCPDLFESETCQIAECPIDASAQKDTVCKKSVSPDLLEGESSCVEASTVDCLKQCKSMDECKGFDEKDGKCCFFSESLDEPIYEKDSHSTCYILHEETASTPTSEAATLWKPNSYAGITVSTIVAVGVLFVFSRMFSAPSDSNGISKGFSTPHGSPEIKHVERDHAEFTPN